MANLRTLAAACLTVATASAGAALVNPALAQAQACDPPRILFVVDGSSSMTQEITEGGVTMQKWAAVQDAVSAVLGAYPDGAQYGLMTFPGAGGGCTPGDTLVEVAAGTAGSIQNQLMVASPAPGSATPAGQTLMEAAFNPAITDPSHANYVIFLSDGWQWCDVGGTGNTTCATESDCSLMGYNMCPSCDSGSDGCYCVRNWPVLGVEALADAGVSTFVVGFGSEVDALTLNQAAAAGGTAPANCDPNSSTASCYLQATVPSELTNALSSIIQAVVTEQCTGACGITGERTCGSTGWSDCVAPDIISCTGPCGATGQQQCIGDMLTDCDAVCDSGTGGGGGAGTAGGPGIGGDNGLGGAGNAPGDNADGGGTDDMEEDGGCGCKVAGAPSAPAPLGVGLGLLAALGLAAQRRRRR